MRKKRELIILVIAVFVLIAFNYNFFDGWITKNFSNQETITVDRVIDGDTVVDTNKIHYRMLGINNKSV